MSERPSQIQLDFLERIKNSTEGHENGGPKEKEGGRGRWVENGGAPGEGGRQGKEENDGQQD